MSAETQKKIQARRLRKVIRRAYEIPFYRKKFDQLCLKPEDIATVEDLRKFPILTKEEYREWMNSELKKEEVKYYKLTKTSGSTGIPTTNIYPPKEYAYHYMMDLFCWIKGGYNPFLGKTLTCAPGDENVGQKTFIQRLGILRRECFDLKEGRENVINTINKYRPDFILGYSAELAYIAQYALQNKLYVHKPKYYCAGGQNVTGEQERVLKAVFGDGMINYYGCTEMADFAYRKPGENGYWIIEDSVAVNVKNDEGIFHYGKGSILATPLFRLRYPLINYAIGDIVDIIDNNGHDYLYDIIGREQDIFYWKNGKQTTHKDVWMISKTLENIYQIRFIQDSNESVIIQAVKDRECKLSIEELNAYVLDKYEDCFGIDTRISIQWIDEIPPDPNGKIRNMIKRFE